MNLQFLTADLNSFPGEAAQIDKTRFATFLEADSAGNTATQWLDQSGHGKDAVANAAFNLTLDAQGRACYEATGTQLFSLSTLRAVPSDYTVYLVVRKSSGTGVRLVDSVSDRWIVQVSEGAVLYNSVGGTMTNYIMPPDDVLRLLVVRLNSAGATLLVNGVIEANGQWVQQPTTSPTYLGGTPDGGGLYGALRGGWYAFGLVVGNDTDAQIEEVRQYFAAKLGTSFL
ncbi:ferritin family protein [Hymenobacter pini]|uniref:hypothetical protein n=1 Tax=Hymenobacter pini TaxID=2880879 RepID=UPI001CF3ACF0|nr:hypothetical protein [Hymenobacter pini]MCA8830168.1 hypothetical protein [Hymenobacter pini]